jgi:hypothetical protein
MTDNFIPKMTDEFIPKPRAPKKVMECDVEADHVASVRGEGGLSLKFTSPGRKSVPDRIDLRGVERLQTALGRLGVHFSLETCKKLLAAAITFTECKAPGKKPTAAQLKEHERLRALGFTVNIVDNKRSNTNG